MRVRESVLFLFTRLRFADKVIEVYESGDVIWIHDYHLLLLPSVILRRVSCAMRVLRFESVARLHAACADPQLPHVLALA
eukprot:1304017-Pleurochrysis_carterae.AAC.1